MSKSELDLCIEKLSKLDNKYKGILHHELLDFFEILIAGINKGYPPNNWLEVEGKRSSHKEMHDSMFHHLAESFSGVKEDKDSKLNPLLHLACRAMMCYTRQIRNIKHPDDK